MFSENIGHSLGGRSLKFPMFSKLEQTLPEQVSGGNTPRDFISLFILCFPHIKVPSTNHQKISLLSGNLPSEVKPYFYMYEQDWKATYDEPEPLFEKGDRAKCFFYLYLQGLKEEGLVCWIDWYEWLPLYQAALADYLESIGQ